MSLLTSHTGGITMEYNDFITPTRKNKHLNEFERGTIEALLKEGFSANAIAKHLNRPCSTITREIKRGTVEQIKQNKKKVHLYLADFGQRQYQKNRLTCGRKFKIGQSPELFLLADQLMKDNLFSPDAAVGFIKRQFPDANFVCTKTIYNYIDLDFFTTKTTDLLLKVKRKNKTTVLRKHKRVLGTSIEDRPDVVNERKELGHWEIDTVVGKRSGCGEVLLTLTERVTRYEHIIKIDSKTSEAVMTGLNDLKSEYGDKFSEVFKTITSDNGSEFSELMSLEETGCRIYFSHPYSSGERGTNENHNGIIRRFIPKGKDLENYSHEFLGHVQEWMNTLPRKILSYATPEEVFENYLDKIYKLAV